MAFRARQFVGELSVKDEQSGNMVTHFGDGTPTPRAIDGDTFTGRHRIFMGKHDPNLGFGVPTEAQLNDRNLLIETLSPAMPWPGSHCDVEGKKAGASAMRNRALLPSEDPKHWPSQQEKLAQKNAHFRNEFPVAYTQRMLAARGIKEDSQEGASRMADARAMEAGTFVERRRGDVHIDLTPPEGAKKQKGKTPNSGAAAGSPIL